MVLRIVSSILLLSLFASALIPAASRARERVATVHVPEELGAIKRELTGTVVPERHYELAFEVDGRVTSASLEMGTLIAEGQPIVTLDSRTAAANLQLARAGLEIARADLTLQQAQYERLATNHARQVVADAELDIALANLERAQAVHRQADAQQKLMQVEFDKRKVRAAFEGRLSSRTPEPGTYVRAGGSFGELMNPERRVRVQVTSSELRGVESGQFDVRTRHPIVKTLKVLAASPLAEADSGMHRLDLRIPTGLTGAPGELLALALIDARSIDNLDRALRRDNDGQYLWMIEDGVARRVDWPEMSERVRGGEMVVMGGDDLEDGRVVSSVPLDSLP